jgi:hypothetical protein
VDDLGGANEDAGQREDFNLFHAGNLDRIRDMPPNASASVRRQDVITISELTRRGFHLIDMSGEIWTMRRPG